MVTSTTVHDQRRRSALNVVGVPLVEKRGAPSDRSVVKDGRGVHIHRILKRVRKHGGVGLERNEDGNCRLQKTEVQRPQNNQSIEILTMHMNATSRHQKCLAVVNGRP